MKAPDADASLLSAQSALISAMANASDLVISTDAQKPAQAAAVLGSGIEVYVALAGLVDFEAERARLEKERGKLEKDADKLGKKLSNEGYLAKAAAEIIEKDRAKHADALDRIARIDAQLAELA